MSEPEADIETRWRRSIEAYHEAALLYAAVKLGLAEKMGARSWRAEDLAQALGLSAPHLARVLRGLSIIGLCQERDDGGFALTALGQSLAQDSQLAAKVQIVVEQYWLPWANLIATLPDGRPAFDQVFGTNVSDWRRTHPAQRAMFASYLARETQAEAEALLAALDVPDRDRVVMIGGADAFPDEIPPHADLCILKGVLQNYGDADAAAILKTCRTAMRNGARLVIVERLMPERAIDDPAAVMLDLHMLAITGGRARTLAEIDALLPAGFRIVKVTSTPAGLTVIEGALG